MMPAMQTHMRPRKNSGTSSAEKERSSAWANTAEPS
jgi:hypothetical protein